MPLGAKVIAYSEKTGVEMFCYGDHILGIQGHPEYPLDIIHNLIDRLLCNGSIQVPYFCTDYYMLPRLCVTIIKQEIAISFFF